MCCPTTHTIQQIASQQVNATEDIMSAVEHLLQYAASWPNAAVCFVASDMRLLVILMRLIFPNPSHVRKPVAYAS